MWSLRLRSQTTLESYLQEAAALNCFAGLPFNVRKDIMLVSEMFTYLPAAALWSSGFLRYLSALLNGWSASFLTPGLAFCKCGIAAWCLILHSCSMWSIGTSYACAFELDWCCCSHAAMTLQTCRAWWIKIVWCSQQFSWAVFIRRWNIYIYILYNYILYHLCIYLPTYLQPTNLPTILSTCLSLSIYLSTYLCICLSICLSVHLSIYLSIHRSMYPSIHPSVCLSVCISFFCILFLFLTFVLPSQSSQFIDWNLPRLWVYPFLILGTPKLWPS